MVLLARLIGGPFHYGGFSIHSGPSVIKFRVRQETSLAKWDREELHQLA